MFTGSRDFKVGYLVSFKLNDDVMSVQVFNGATRFDLLNMSLSG